MNALLHKLAEICRDHRLRQKLLVVPSHQAGHQLLAALARHGTAWVNLHPVTIQDLAGEVGGIGNTLSRGQGLSLLDDLLQDMDDNTQLRYFRALHRNEQADLTRVLYDSLQALRKAGVRADELMEDRFIDPEKGREVKQLLAGFEQRLQASGFSDETDSLSKAIATLSLGAKSFYQGALFLVPEQLELEQLAATFLNQLSDGRRITLPDEPVLGLPNPFQELYKEDNSPQPVSRISWLYDIEAIPAEAAVQDINITRSYGSANEVRAILRQFAAGSIPFDQAVICYTRGERYIPLLYAMAKRFEIPLTFAEGVPLHFTGPGRLMFGLLNWLENDYSELELYRLLVGGDINSQNSASMAKLLRSAGIGFGRERYLRLLPALQKRIQQAHDADEWDVASQLEHLQELIGLTNSLFSNIPAPDESGCVDFVALCQGLIRLVQQHSPAHQEISDFAVATIKGALQEAACSTNRRFSLSVACRRIRLWLAGANVGASAPRPGHLHVVGFSQAGWEHRPYTYLVGLEADLFPGEGQQDPVLLDEERARISASLMLRRQSPERNVYRMVRFLASRRGPVTLSYSCQNVVEGKPSAPAALLLQVYRLLQGKPDVDYTEMLGKLPAPTGYLPDKQDQALDEDEWWLGDGGRPSLLSQVAAVLDCYPGLRAGITAWQGRLQLDLTVYEGKVNVDPAKVDPRLSRRALSASQLESLARCPYSWFLRYALRLSPVETVSPDQLVWLDPLTRGTLLHEIYCRFQRQAYAPAAQAQPPGETMLYEIAEELITELKEEVPPPSQLVYDHEHEQLMRGLAVFWRLEKEQLAQARPAYFEVPFGFGPEEAADAGLGLAEPVTLELLDGSLIRLRGRIDRVDFVDDGEYQVWDFKTGSAYGYDDDGYIKRGQQLQHALYSLALEQVLQRSGKDPAARVTTAGYVFPTEKGEGQRIRRPQANRRLALEAVGHLLDLLRSGTFCPTDDDGHCTYCDYRAICRSSQAAARMKSRLENAAEDILAAWRELKQYE